MKTGKKVQMVCNIRCGHCEAEMHLGSDVFLCGGRRTQSAGDRDSHEGGDVRVKTGDSPKYCACCGGSLGRFCITCAREVEMFFDEWWPSEAECVRIYYPAKHCPRCNALLENPDNGPEEDGQEDV
ncbi:MAG: hypothetical protein ABIG11_05900 [bacterium]